MNKFKIIITNKTKEIDIMFEGTRSDFEFLEKKGYIKK